MQQDVEFGIIQIVDIALRAISPAVNDPSTAISCIDQLSRVLIRWTSRAPPRGYLHRPPHILRVVVPWIGFDGLLDTVFEQIRHYSKSDIAVSLRLVRAFDDIAGTGLPQQEQQTLAGRAQRVVKGCEDQLPESDLVKLRRRLARLEMQMSARGVITTFPAVSTP
jgi:uncharacterized membrane protein